MPICRKCNENKILVTLSSGLCITCETMERTAIKIEADRDFENFKLGFEAARKLKSFEVYHDGEANLRRQLSNLRSDYEKYPTAQSAWDAIKGEG